MSFLTRTSSPPAPDHRNPAGNFTSLKVRVAIPQTGKRATLRGQDDDFSPGCRADFHLGVRAGDASVRMKQARLQAGANGWEMRSRLPCHSAKSGLALKVSSFHLNLSPAGRNFLYATTG